MNKLRMFFKLLLVFGYIMNRVLANTVCEPCNCCKDSICPNSLETGCTAGCLNGYTGFSCQNKCPDNCESCNQYFSSYCLQCKIGYYIGQLINDCTLKCPTNCNSCLSDTYCSSCKDGFYNGENNNTSYRDCRLPCYSGCKACKLYDVCTECKDGYFGQSPTANNCSEKCRPQCKTCTTYNNCSECLNGFYGPYCQHNCSNGCVDTICNKDNGSCECKSTYWGQNCENTCSQGCVLFKCFNETGQCTSGCKTGYTGDVCDKCELEFTKVDGICTDCTDKCEECFNGLCFKCKENHGGLSCQTSCPDNCRSCVSEQLCTECIYGYFGENCSSICPANCLSKKGCSNNCTDVCDHLTGECGKGCNDNYWGKRCENACSRNCKDVTGQNKCDQSIGHCLGGCTDGFFSEKCDKKCSINCFNRSCDNIGKCSYGCTGEYEDDLCLQAKLQITERNNGYAAIIGGSVSGCLILVIVIGIAVAVVFRNRRKRTDAESKEENSTVVYCNVNNRGHLSHPETKETETNQSHTAHTSNKEKPPVAQKQSVTKSISNVYEKITRRADSREYSTLSYDTNQSDLAFSNASLVPESEEHNYYNTDIVNGVHQI